MALHYHLEKVYELSDNDTAFVMQIGQLFVTEIPEDLQQLKNGIDEKNHQRFLRRPKPDVTARAYVAPSQRERFQRGER